MNNDAANNKRRKRPDKVQQGHDNQEWGIMAEQLTEEYFLKMGYTVRERNWRLNRLEIDRIFEKDRTIIFCEVKARQGGGQDPESAVDFKKRRRIIDAANSYMQQLEHLYEYRFDIVTFTGTPDEYKMRHYEDAYLPTVNGHRR